MNLRILILTLATFAIGTGTFVVTGILSGVSEEFSVSVESAGHLVTVFAVAYAVGSPVLVTLTEKVPRRWLIVAALVLFAVANGAAAIAPSFGLLLAARVAAALGAAVLTPVAGAVAADLAAPEKQGRALSLVIGGMTVAWVVGIPLGTLVGDEFGWRASFVMVGALAAVAAVAVAAVLPDVDNPPVAGLRSMFALAGRAAILAVLGITSLGVAAGFVVLTYVRPLLEGLTGFGGGGIGALLLVFGVASIAGNSLGGYWADRRGYRGGVGGILVVLALSLLSFSLLTVADAGSGTAVLGAVAALITWSVAGFAIIPLQQYRLIRTVPESRNTVLSLNASAIYLGQGVGSALGSIALGYGSIAALGWVGALCAGAALILLLASIRSTKGEAAAEQAAA